MNAGALAIEQRASERGGRRDRFAAVPPTRALAALWLLAILGVVTIGPLVRPLSPDQPFGGASARLAPGTLVDTVTFSDGRRWVVERARVLDGDRVGLTAFGRERSFSLSRLRDGSLTSARGQQRFPLGTDAQGRDVLARLMDGGRRSLAIGFAAAALGLLIGASIGLTAGSSGRLVDGLLMRLTDVNLAFPTLFVAILIVRLWSPTPTTVVVVLAATTWMGAARLARSEAQGARNCAWAQAARASGASRWRMAWRHILPAAWAPLAIDTILRVGDTVLLESTLSFLGVGLAPPAATWGNLVADGQAELPRAWWIAAFPTLAIVTTVLALHTIAGPRRRS